MEADLIAHLRRRLPAHPLLRLGIGDDAAVLRMAGVEECVITVDMMMDQVDFELGQVDARRIGRKALAINLSDLAAMASEPLAGVVAVALPRSGGMNLAVELYEGMLPLAEEFAVAIAGGDTNSWNGPLVISVTLLGKLTARGALRRSGARPGDRLLVTGSLGGSILGRHLDFQPRVREALALMRGYELHAGMDISDGLSIDLARLTAESGCGAEVWTDAVPIAEDAYRLVDQLADGSSPLEHALNDGEDFELLLAAPPEEAERMLAEQPLGVPLRMIGEFVVEPGVWQIGATRERLPMVPRGYQHEFD
ncbi:MAG: thiamine-phosphate kinase [Thermoguttaceae bacterium]|jgi:thiamine-monophosphate kinase